MTIFGNTGRSISLAIALFLAACGGTKYTSFDESNGNRPAFQPYRVYNAAVTLALQRNARAIVRRAL